MKRRVFAGPLAHSISMTTKSAQVIIRLRVNKDWGESGDQKKIKQNEKEKEEKGSKKQEPRRGDLFVICHLPANHSPPRRLLPRERPSCRP